MRTALYFGRCCLKNAFRQARCSQSSTFAFKRQLTTQTRGTILWRSPRKPNFKGPILIAALTPAAIVKLSEDDNGNGESGEKQMLEASRDELRKEVPDDAHGLSKMWKTVVLFLDTYLYEPLATGFRFLHLVIIFVPVIATVPVIWVGRRQKDKDNERSGTLWWYWFLVHSMERAGAAFIKVS